MGRALSWLRLVMVLLTVFGFVASVTASVSAATANQDWSLYCHALVFMGRSPWALQRDDLTSRGHLFSAACPPRRGKALVDLTGSLISCLPMWPVFLAWNCWDYVARLPGRGKRAAQPCWRPCRGGIWRRAIILLLVAACLFQAYRNHQDPLRDNWRCCDPSASVPVTEATGRTL